MNLSSSTILVVDDNSTNRFVVEMQLKSYQCNVVTAANGLEAVSKYEEIGNQLDLILMDISMPEMDGYEATEAIRKLEQTNNAVKIPIVALTAHAFKEDRDKCLNAGMDDYLAKPFSDHDFIEIVKKHLNYKDIK